MPDIKFSKRLVFVNSAVPFVLLAWDAYHHRLGVNPQEFVLHTTGTLALVFLCLSLAVTPLRKALGLPWLIQLRRTLGLFAFFYGCLHLLAYTWFDKSFNLAAIVEDTLKRPFIFLGMFAFLVLNQQDGQTHRRKAMESLAQAGLRRGDLRRDSLLPAG
jgi:sulfoxide reductase heme-binding subunit YedZ